MFEGPLIDPRIAAIAPDFRAISIFVDAKRPVAASPDAGLLASVCKAVAAGEPAWADAHLASWQETYLRFGAKPNRTPSSAQALRKRVLKDGCIPSINPVVDLYNAVSLRFAVPVGGEDYDGYAGRPLLTVADGTEPFEIVANGEPIVEHPAPGEVIWRDDMGVTCRRWNWRQGTRTRLEAASRRMWFIIEALGTMPEDALESAGDMLAKELRRLMPGCDILRQKLSAADR